MINSSIDSLLSSAPIGILNLMPEKEKSVQQLKKRLTTDDFSNLGLNLFYPKTHYQHKPLSDELKNYHIYDLKNPPLLKALIITGAPVEKLDFEQVDYWQEFTEIIDNAKARKIPCFFICWAAQAALYHFYSITKEVFPEKTVGVFSHQILTPTHPLFSGEISGFKAPHSRYSNSSRKLIENTKELTILADSKEAGIYAVANQGNSEIYVFGHGEYDQWSLAKEYQRDLKSQVSTPFPKHYFPNNQSNQVPIYSWNTHGQRLFSNWLKYIVSPINQKNKLYSSESICL